MIGPAALLAAALLQAGGHGPAAGGHGTVPGGHATAPAEPLAVSIGFDDYEPARAAVLVGDTVHWMNDSARAHTVSAPDGAFESGRIEVGLGYEHAFAVAGAYPYLCRLHPFMQGEVDAYDVLLDAPAHAAGPDRPFPMTGRAAIAGGGEVAIEADTGSGFVPAGTATVAADGSFSTTVTPETTATYRARAGDAVSPAVQLVVLDRHVTAHVRRLGGGRTAVSATVAPASPGATVVLQLHLRNRFGWWPVRRARLDARSHVAFAPVHPRRRVPARVVLTLPDGATKLAVSAPLRVG